MACNEQIQNMYENIGFNIQIDKLQRNVNCTVVFGNISWLFNNVSLIIGR